MFFNVRCFLVYLLCILKFGMYFFIGVLRLSLFLFINMFIDSEVKVLLVEFIVNKVFFVIFKFLLILCRLNLL